MSLYHRFRDRFGAAGVIIGVIALVMALVTGAYAAGGGLSGKQKKEVKKIAKKFAGKPGPAGPQGNAGAPGTNGTNGKDGTNGRSVVVSTTASGCQEGGITVRVEGSSEENEVCNGEEGPAGPTTTSLPSGQTETGLWSLLKTNLGGTSFPRATISFPFKLPFSLSGSHIIWVDVSHSRTAGSVTHCPGTFSEPKADAEYLCIYTLTFPGPEIFPPTGPEFEPEPVPSSGGQLGAFVGFGETEKEHTIGASGTWAVHAP